MKITKRFFSFQKYINDQREILMMNTFNIKSYTKILHTLCSIIATNTINCTLVCEVEAAAPRATPSAKFEKGKT